MRDQLMDRRKHLAHLAKEGDILRVVVVEIHCLGDLVQVPLDPPLTTSASLIWLHDRPMSRAARAFAQFAREQRA